jgi:glycosyltransferase involved in cell wall biosynthesis
MTVGTEPPRRQHDIDQNWEAMRVTFILPSYPWRPIGAIRVVYEYANQLVDRGHEVTVVHARRIRDVKGFFAPRGLHRSLRRRAAQARDMLLAPKVRWQAVDGRVQMRYVKEPTTNAVPEADAVFATAWDTVPYVFEYPSSRGSKFHLVQSYDYWSQLDVQTAARWRSSFKKVVISKWLYDQMLQLGCSHVAYIPNAINHSTFLLTRPIAGRPKRVAMLFSMQECKGSEYGVRAILLAKEKHRDLRAVLFGIPSRPRGLPTWIEYLRDPPQYELVRDVYNGSSIFLCPSIREASPLPPAEAMACGCALVTADCGGTAEYAQDGVTALFCPPRAPEALAESMSALLENSDRRIELAEEGHRRMRELNWENSALKLLEFVRSHRDGSEGADGIDGAAAVSSGTPYPRQGLRRS